jgi:hypothetical protein
MLRQPNSQTVTVAAAVADSTTIDLQHHAFGSFQLPSASGTTEITVYSNLGEGWQIAKDADQNDIVLLCTAGAPTRLPPDAFAFPQIRLVASAGSATAEVPISIKS